MGVVAVPDDLGRRPVDADQVEQRAQVALGLGGRAAAERAAGRHLGHLGREIGIVERERVEEEERRPALLDVVGQVVDLLLGQRRRLGDQQDVEVGGDRRVGRDRAHVVLLLQLGDDRPFGGLADRPHVEAAHQLGVGAQDADLLAAAPRDDADRPRQLVLDRQAAVEERDDDFLEARGERDAQEDLRDRLLGLGLIVGGDPLAARCRTASRPRAPPRNRARSAPGSAGSCRRSRPRTPGAGPAGRP